MPIWRRIAGIFQLCSLLSSRPATNTLPLLARCSRRISLQEGRLAGAGGSNQEDELPLVDVDIDVLECRATLAVVGLGDIFKTNHGVLLPPR